MGGWFTLQGVPIKYDDCSKLVNNTARYLKASVTGLLPLQETSLSTKLKKRKEKKEMVSGETKCKIRNLFFFLQGVSVKIWCIHYRLEV